MPTFGKLESFEGPEETWPAYLEQLEEYFTANDITDVNKCRSIFLASCGTKCYATLRNLVAPMKPKEKTFLELTKVLSNYYAPVPSEIVMRHRFHVRWRQSGESVAGYMAELRKLSGHCNYGPMLEEQLRDQLVCGINNDKIQERLFAEPGLTYVKAVDIALAMEMANRDVSSVQSRGQGEQHNEKAEEIEVNKVVPGSSRKDLRSNRDRDIKDGVREKVMCYKCRSVGHYANECKQKKIMCYKCRKNGHIARFCQANVDIRSQEVLRENDFDNQKKVTNHLSINDDIVYDLYSLLDVSDKPIHVEVKIQGKPVKMEVDSGAAISVISIKKYRELWQENKKLLLEPSCVKLKGYFGKLVKSLGNLTTLVEYKGVEKELKLCVTPGEGPTLMGRNWLKELKVVPELFELVQETSGNVNNVNVAGNTIQSLIREYEKLFSGGLGTLKGVEVDIQVSENAVPKFFKSRPVPFALQNKIETELDRLVKAGVLTPVKYARWATPIVPICKEDGSVRITGDFKVTVNPISLLEQYPVPRIDELFAKLAKGKKFTKIDLRDAYFQMTLEKKSRELVTINTHKGLFQYTRLPQGVSSAPAIFLRAMDGLFGDMKNVAIFFDDFLITGVDDGEHISTLREVFDRLQKAGLRLKKEKCIFLEPTIEYLGFKLDAEGLHPTDDKIRAIREAPAPKNIKELQSYLGLLNYYRKFLPGVSSWLHPLYELLKKDVKWRWMEKERGAFEYSKTLLTSEKVLTYFDPTKAIVVSCDASPYGIGAVLSHRLDDGTERPVGFASRSLAKAEKNYAQLDKEALALIFAVSKFRQYLYGFPFELQTDHKPLLGLFQKGRAIPINSSPRIVRWATILAAFEYDLIYKKGINNENADALSRLPLGEMPLGVVRPPEVFMLEKQYPQLLSPKIIALHTNRDPILSRVRNFIWAGEEIPNTDKELLPYRSRQCELSIQENCLLWGGRVIMPKGLQNQMVDLVHEGHPGICKMKNMARVHVWWPGLDRHLEDKVDLCRPCQEKKNDPKAALMRSWPHPKKPWSRLHIDHAGPFRGKIYLLIVDAYSKWVEIAIVPSTASANTIKTLRYVFASQGIPDTIVSDNGTSFESVEFKLFLKANAIEHIAVPPYHPASNGAAERMVQTMKSKLKLMESGDSDKNLARFLLNYRTQPHSTTGVSPAELLYKRKLKTVLSSIHPDMHNRIQEGQLKSKISKDTLREEKNFRIGESVYVKNFRRGPKWVPGVIEEQTSEVIFLVRVDKGLWRRHSDHIRHRVLEIKEGSKGNQIEYMPEGKGQDSLVRQEVVGEMREGLQSEGEVEIDMGEMEVVKGERLENGVDVEEAMEKQDTSRVEGSGEMRRSTRIRKAPDRWNW